MLIDEFTKIFLKIEKENNLFNLKSGSENFWNYIRYSLFEEIAFNNKTNERIEFSNFGFKIISGASYFIKYNFNNFNNLLIKSLSKLLLINFLIVIEFVLKSFLR